MFRHFRPPNFALACYTLPFLAALLVGPWLIYATGDAPWYLFAAMLVGVCAFLMWFGFRPAGYVFGAAMGLFATVGVIVLLFGEVEIRLIVKTLLYAHAAYEAFAWARRANDTVQELPSSNGPPPSCVVVDP